MFVFIKKVFLVTTTPLSCISMNNQACKVRPKIINVNSNEPVFYPSTIKRTKCSCSCNNINDRYAVKDLNIKVFHVQN